MAHTDKTDPFRVKIWHGALGRVAEHDHTDGICDLPRTLADFLAQDPRRTSACTWSWSDDGTGLCGCEVCRGQTSERRVRRGERRRTRMSLGEQRKRWRAAGSLSATAAVGGP